MSVKVKQIRDFDEGVSANNSVVGTVTAHSDITSAGSGDIITNTERNNLNNQSGTNSGDEVIATETTAGISFIATQTEVNDGVNDTDFVTPLKLKNLLGVISSSVATTNATQTEIDKIDTLTDNTVHFIEVKATCKSDDDLKYGTWNFVLNVTKFNGTVVIRNEDTVHHHSASGLSANSISFAVNSGDIDIDVTGIVATNIQWDCKYEIKITSTN